MDLSRLRTGERTAAISALVLIVVMFMDWYGVKVSTGLASVNVSGGADAWESFSFIDIILFVTALSALALAYVTASQTQVNLPVTVSAITAGLGGLSLLLVLFRLIDTPFDVPSGVDITRKFGLFLGLIAVAGIAYGAWRAMAEEGTSSGGDRARRPAPAPPAAEPPATPPPPPPPSDAPASPPSEGYPPGD